MINKKEILKSFLSEEQDEVLKVYNLMNLAYEKEICTFTNFFCTPNIWKYFVNNFNSKNFIVEASGAYDECDRKVLCFNNVYNAQYPYKVLKIINKSKFSNLVHKDYLGAVMSLGINRDKIGDIRVEDNYAFMPVQDDICEYIIENLNVIGKAPVSCEEIDRKSLPAFEFEHIVINVSAFRIDSIVAKLANISRTKAIELIQCNKVLIDYSKVKSKSEEVLKDDVITIRGTGKFIVGDIVGNTKSGKIKTSIRKYV